MLSLSTQLLATHTVDTHTSAPPIPNVTVNTLYNMCTCSGCSSWLFFISIVFQASCLLSVCKKAKLAAWEIKLYENLACLHMAHGYHVKLQRLKHTKWRTIYERNSAFNSLVWSLLMLTPIILWHPTIVPYCILWFYLAVATMILLEVLPWRSTTISYCSMVLAGFQSVQ